jgi:hypothetical protein
LPLEGWTNLCLFLENPVLGMYLTADVVSN